MQDREQIQKEIDAVKLQINIAEMSALTAQPEEQAIWRTKRDSLQLRLDELEKSLQESVVYDGDNAASIIDDATAEAMLNEILNATEETEPALQPDETISLQEEAPFVLQADEPTETQAGEPIVLQPDVQSASQADEPIVLQSDVPSEGQNAFDDNATIDGALRGKQLFDEARAQEENAEPVIDNILFTAMDEEQAHAATNDETSDEAAQAMFDEIMRAAQENATDDVAPKQEEPTPKAQEQTESEDEEETELSREAAAAHEMLRKILGTAGVQKDEPPAPQETENLVPQTKADAFVSPVPPRPRRSDARCEHCEERAEIDRLRKEAEDACAEAERMRKEAEEIRLSAETERAMYAAEMELQRGLREREDGMRQNRELAEKGKLYEKIARRKAEISALRNELQNIKKSEDAFALREKFLAIELALDDEERANAELSYLLTKSIDDVAHALEVADLKRKIAALTAAAKRSTQKRAAAKKKAAAAKKKKAAAASAAKKKKAAAAAAAKKRRMAALHGSARRMPPRR